MPNAKDNVLEIFSSQLEMQKNMLAGLKQNYENDIFSSLRDIEPEEYVRTREEQLKQIQELEEKVKDSEKRVTHVTALLNNDNVVVSYAEGGK